MRTRTVLFCALAILLMAALPAAAVEPILRGIDAWTTVPEGTFANLHDEPLPAGFFCNQFEGFSGKIYLQGVPIATENGTLARTDTIVERLDNATFDKHGEAFTRVRLLALQLTGVETFKTVCGEYKVYVTLDGEQPLSRMHIQRLNNKGGRFSVPLAVNAKIIFVRTDNESEKFEIPNHARFTPNPLNHWAYRRVAQLAKRVPAPLVIDTDWDGTPDTQVPAQSNFVPGSYGNKATLEYEEAHVVQ